MEKCRVCPRGCNINRKTTSGLCGAKEEMVVNLFELFFFEEPCISGKNGSGAIFFSGCVLGCEYCQNYDISHSMKGENVSVSRLVEIMKELESKGAENINFVNPTHFTTQIIEALKLYKPSIPIVWNTHGYENEEQIELLSSYIDIFLTDFKYFDNQTAKKYSHVGNYVEVAKKALEKMVESKPLRFNENGMLEGGVIVRHLVLPLHTDESKNILRYLGKKYGTKILVSLMSQFTPFGNCDKFVEINRKITKREYQIANKIFIEQGLIGYTQKYESADKKYIPEWK